MRRGRLLIAGLAALVLSACATLPEPVDDPKARYQEAVERLRAQTDWDASGRAALRTADDAGSLSLEWRQRGETYQVDLRAPLGAGSARLEGGPEGVWLTTSAGDREYAPDPETLVAWFTGYQVPVSALRYWLRGLDAPGPEVERLDLDPAGRPERLHQAGWEVVYRDWSQTNGLPLPRRLDISRGEDSVRVVIRDWSLAP
ncbi:lipoprotein insertase outer membrane protein LolB [Alkalilimnicola ehrlichii MLHE-1]|uniref:Outer-membrane lipoprotein LolB n=1 Tax=Alkalilimnicola ehrlichii (strain ATCC BAA-1101 / DSM 17681 / MLHE-1) TaxID=187272 RepID=LOLB_ALKEH|nr:lipoprotein insertase outer membrane protein LolB [Alkalilimnicola ehrlichii]Q0AC01.1 RecName: Full=Outer-membrane lipoprotein LolB; Flags: Precursor [Alkalilimnicola ehrlichii MLHE-1]ABI55636.1 outer membrane lipoprotein LolB [Alkalilimnicola ehrlichii MLHE-1]